MMAFRRRDGEPALTSDVDVPGAGGVGIGGDNYAPITTTVNQVRTPVVWPHRVGIVPRLAESFQARAVTDDFTAGSITATVWVLSGMGGVGKTQLAVSLAEQLWHAREVDLLVWVAATSREAILEGYAQAAVDVGARGGC